MAQVFLGMSGGVDSSAAAVLLQAQGYAVSGLHLSLLSGLPLPADPPSRMTAPTPGPWHPCWGFPSTIWTSPRNFGQQLSTISSGNTRWAARRIPAYSATGGSSSAPCGTLPKSWGRTIWPPATTPKSDRILPPAVTCSAGGRTVPRTRATFSAG